MSYVILDLEWNAAYSKSAHKYVNEIIEFGAVKTDDNFQITDTFSALIQPKIGKKLSGRVKQLTKITNEELADGGIDFLSVTEAFTRFLGESALMTWGISDIHALIENYEYFTGDYHIPFLSSYCDIQDLCARALNKYDAGNQMGLSNCAEMLGIDFSEEDQHRAYADAKLSLRCLNILREKLPLSDYVFNAREESFYDRMMFKTYFITDVDNPEFDGDQLVFYCPYDACGKKLKGKWHVHNKSFAAELKCPGCFKKYNARVSFKRKYDGVKINRKLSERQPKPETTKLDLPESKA